MKAANWERTHYVFVRLVLLAVAVLLAVIPAYATGSNSLMITQFYAMGGSAGSSPSTYVENYVELYNNGYTDIDFTKSDWTIQFQTPTGAMSTSTSYYLGGTHGGNTVTYGNGFNGVLHPGQFMLITTATAGAGAGHVPLTADLAIDANTPTVAGNGAAIASLYAATNGQIAVVNSTSPMTCTGTNPHGNSPDPVMDFVGYGTAACYEGSAAAVMSTGSATKVRAMWRGLQSPNSGTGNTGLNFCSGDTDSNNADFQYVEIQTKSTYNQDQSWTLHDSTEVYSYNGTAFALGPYTPVPTPACGIATANPANVPLAGGSTTFYVRINPTVVSVTPFSVTADLSQFGLSNAVPLTDDGMGTNTYASLSQSIPSATQNTLYSIPFTAKDSATPPANVTIPKLPFLVGTPASATLTANSTSGTYNKSKTFTYAITGGNVGNTPVCNVTQQPTYTVTNSGGGTVTFPWEVGTLTITPSGASAADCTFTYAAGTFTVSPGTQAAKISCPSVSQGVANASYTGSPIACPVTATAGTCDPATFTGVAPTVYGPTTVPPTNVGSYSVQELGACHSTDTNWADPTLPTPVTLNVGQGTPVVKVNCNPVTYDGTPRACVPGATASTDNSGTTPVAGTFAALSYAGTNGTTYGPGTNPPTELGDYLVSATFTPADTVNWLNGAGSDTMTISPQVQALTVTADDKPMYVGDPLPSLTFHTTPAGVTLATPPTCTTTATPVSAPGSYPITCSGAVDARYSPINYVAGTLTIYAPLVTVTADDKLMSFGGTLPALTFHTTPSNVTLVTPPACTTTATSSSVPGPYSIVCAGGADPSYTIAYVPGTLTVNPVPLAVQADDASMGFGGPLPTFTFRTSPAGITLATAPTCTTTATLTSVPGTYPITCSGAADIRYSPITYTAGTLTVNPAPLTVTADDGSMYYGGPLPTLTFHTTPAGAALTTAPTCTTTATTSSPVGKYAITCSGGADVRYSPITYVNGSLTVNAPLVTVTADDKSMNYGGSLPALTFHTTPAGITLVTQPACTTAATASSTPGTYPITCSGGADPNYTISYAAGTLTVNKSALTVTADDASMNYGGPLPTLTFHTTPAGVTLSTPPACTTTATTSSNPGTYPITCSGGADARYSITYADGALTVNATSLTVVADDKSMTYGGPLPALTFHTSPSGVTLGTAPACTTTATATSAPGTYPITCSGGADPRYAPITYTAGTLTVNPASLTITADNKSMVMGSALPTLTYHTDHDPISPALATAPACTTTATTSSAPGTYSITCSGATDPRYAIAYAAGTLTVTGNLTLTPPASGTTATVTAGQTATYAMQIAGWSGASVSFTCAGAPALSTCTVSPNPLPLTGTAPAAFTVSIATTGAGSAAAAGMITPGSSNGSPLGLMITLSGTLVALLMTLKAKKQWRAVGAFAALLMVISLSACGNGKATTRKTASGTYPITVTATSGSVTKNITLTLNVQ